MLLLTLKVLQSFILKSISSQVWPSPSPAQVTALLRRPEVLRSLACKHCKVFSFAGPRTQRLGRFPCRIDVYLRRVVRYFDQDVRSQPRLRRDEARFLLLEPGPQQLFIGLDGSAQGSGASVPGTGRQGKSGSPSARPIARPSGSSPRLSSNIVLADM